jgi:DNA-binding FadR family transcriptional regulator
MPLIAIKNRSLTDEVFEQLAHEIMAGHYPPGSSLHSGHLLAETFGVNRHVVRDALKRLEQIGLLEITQGGDTKVLDFRRRAGLDLVAVMAEYPRGGMDVADNLLAVVEMCAAIAADVARLCAIRGPSSLKSELVGIARRMQNAVGDHDRFRLEVHFGERAIEGADNLVYRLAFNSLIKGLYGMGKVAAERFADERRSTGCWIRIATAIASGDAAKAEAETREAMGKALGLLADISTRSPPIPARQRGKEPRKRAKKSGTGA